ncbi:MAG: hypothetical protein ACJ798_15615 [Phenylobacterium sp.]
MKRVVVFAGGVLAAVSVSAASAAGVDPAAPAPAPAVQAGPTYAPPKAADQKDGQLICRSEAVLGSRMPVRRCRTVGDIKDRQLQDRQNVEHAQQNLQIRGN